LVSGSHPYEVHDQARCAADVVLSQQCTLQALMHVLQSHD